MIVEYNGRRVRIRSKAESKLMRFIAFFLGKEFMTSFWTTVSAYTIWAPVTVDLTKLEPRHFVTIEHELIHTQQAFDWPFLWQLAYLLLPLPFGFAYVRWRSERVAYLMNLRAGTLTIDDVCDLLWRKYFWTWPRKWMRRWFEKQLRE